MMIQNGWIIIILPYLSNAINWKLMMPTEIVTQVRQLMCCNVYLSCWPILVISFWSRVCLYPLLSLGWYLDWKLFGARAECLDSTQKNGVLVCDWGFYLLLSWRYCRIIMTAKCALIPVIILENMATFLYTKFIREVYVTAGTSEQLNLVFYVFFPFRWTKPEVLKSVLLSNDIKHANGEGIAFFLR